MAEFTNTYSFKFPMNVLRETVEQFVANNKDIPLRFEQLTIRRLNEQGKKQTLNFSNDEFNDFLLEYLDAKNIYIYFELKSTDSNNSSRLALNFQGPPEKKSPETELTVKNPGRERVDNVFFYVDKINEMAQRDDQNAPILNEQLYPVTLTQEQIDPILSDEEENLKTLEELNSAEDNSETFNLLTEDGSPILTEDGNPIQLEEGQPQANSPDANETQLSPILDTEGNAILDTEGNAISDGQGGAISDGQGGAISDGQGGTLFVPGVQTADAETAEEVNSTDDPEISVFVKALSDKPTSIDLLGYKDYAKALVDFAISNNTDRPLTIGIDAPWGMGKTSLMKMIEKELEEDYPTVWFNAWKYDSSEQLWGALIQRILKTSKKDFSPKQHWLWFWKLKFSRVRKNFLIRPILAFLVLFVVLTTGYIFISVFWDHIDFQELTDVVISYPRSIGISASLTLLYAFIRWLWNATDLSFENYFEVKNYQNIKDLFSEFNDDFNTIINIITNNGKTPISIFIDDLDRATPAGVVEIFEAINLLMDSDHCVFFVGMDSQIIAASIEAKYSEIFEASGSPSLFGHHFLEKIVQINFHLPKAKDTSIQEYISNELAPSKGDQPSEKNENLIRTTAYRIQNEMRDSSITQEGAKKKVKQKFPETSSAIMDSADDEVRSRSIDESEIVKQAILDVIPYLRANPRNIKRFINLFRLKLFIANRRGLIESGIIDIGHLARFLLIELQYPDVYNRKDDFLKDYKNIYTHYHLALTAASNLEDILTEEPLSALLILKEQVNGLYAEDYFSYLMKLVIDLENYFSIQ